MNDRVSPISIDQRLQWSAMRYGGSWPDQRPPLCWFERLMHNAMQPSRHERPQSIVHPPLNAVDRLAVPDPHPPVGPLHCRRSTNQVNRRATLIDPNDARTLWRITMLDTSAEGTAPEVLASTFARGAM